MRIDLITNFSIFPCRLTQALNGLKDYKAAYEAFTQGLQVEPGNVDLKASQLKAKEQMEVGFFNQLLQIL